jgi:hypothetical protein
MSEEAAPTQTTPVSDLRLLDDAECRAVRDKVHELRPYWFQRRPTHPFFTLGAASYLDAQGRNPEYYRKAAQYNPVLQEHFGWLYSRLAEVLTEHLGEPVEYKERCGLPGFHIFLAHPDFEKPQGSIHRDLQYELIEWKGNIDLSRPISFTASIALPSGGAGLNVWDFHHDEILSLDQREVARTLGSREKTFHPYRAGFMAMHSGHTVHQIAPAKNLQPDDERITLQGHGVSENGRWQIYW